MNDGPTNHIEQLAVPSVLDHDGMVHIAGEIKSGNASSLSPFIANIPQWIEGQLMQGTLAFVRSTELLFSLVNLPEIMSEEQVRMLAQTGISFLQKDQEIYKVIGARLLGEVVSHAKGFENQQHEIVENTLSVLGLDFPKLELAWKKSIYMGAYGFSQEQQLPKTILENFRRICSIESRYVGGSRILNAAYNIENFVRQDTVVWVRQLRSAYSTKVLVFHGKFDNKEGSFSRPGSIKIFKNLSNSLDALGAQLEIHEVGSEEDIERICLRKSKANDTIPYVILIAHGSKDTIGLDIVKDSGHVHYVTVDRDNIPEVARSLHKVNPSIELILDTCKEALNLGDDSINGSLVECFAQQGITTSGLVEESAIGEFIVGTDRNRDFSLTIRSTEGRTVTRQGANR